MLALRAASADAAPSLSRGGSQRVLTPAKQLLVVARRKHASKGCYAPGSSRTQIRRSLPLGDLQPSPLNELATFDRQNETYGS